jgi:6-phosphogluconolactonase
MTPDVRIFPDLEALSHAAAASVAQIIRQTCADRGRVVLALAGGHTPARLYQLLAESAGETIPWRQVHLCWSDERYVPLDHPDSNFRMAKESFLDRIDIPESNVHPMPTHFANPQEAARAYENELRRLFPPPWPRFDLLLLGMGPDGHTASLFPGSAALEENKRWVLATTSPAEPKQRLSLTLPVLSNAATIYFLISGRDKAGTLATVLSGVSTHSALPAARVRLSNGKVVWWIDEAAARAFALAR